MGLFQLAVEAVSYFLSYFCRNLIEKKLGCKCDLHLNCPFDFCRSDFFLNWGVFELLFQKLVEMKNDWKRYEFYWILPPKPKYKTKLTFFKRFRKLINLFKIIIVLFFPFKLISWINKLIYNPINHNLLKSLSSINKIKPLINKIKSHFTITFPLYFFPFPSLSLCLVRK